MPVSQLSYLFSIHSDEEVRSKQGAAGAGSPSVGAQSETSETGSTVTEEPVWKPDACFPAFKSMMEEQDLNIKLVTVKQDVSGNKSLVVRISVVGVSQISLLACLD